MNELRVLTVLELRALYGINRFRYTKAPKERNRYRMLAVAWGIIITILLFYVGALVYGLSSLGLGEIVPAYLAFLTSILIFIFGIFQAGNMIFAGKGYDLLVAMPVRAGSIVTARLIALYVGDLAWSLVVMLPGTVVYGILNSPSLGFYATALLGTLLLPAIPLVASVLLGTLILAIASKSKHKTLTQTILMIASVTGILIASFSLGGMTDTISPEQLTSLASALGRLIQKIYPPALWLGNAMLSLDPLSLLLFTVLSLLLLALCVLVTARFFHRIMQKLSASTTKKAQKQGKIKSRSLLQTLYLRELKRYFSSSIYVVNTIIGPILGFLMALALCIFGTDSLTTTLPIDIVSILPFVLAAIFCMMPTTAVSISMEGKQFWVIRSLPIASKELFDSKILLNLSLMLPFYLLSEICVAIALMPSPIDLLRLVLIPLLLMVFSAVFGITVNLKFHRFDWEKEESVVKQSAAAFFGGFAGTFFSLLLTALSMVIPNSCRMFADTAVCLAVIILTLLLYRKNNTVQLQTL